MSRGPLDVLREAVAAMPVQMCCGMFVGGGMDEYGNGEPPSCCGQPIHTDDVNEAIAQVEALVEAATSWLEVAMESNHGITRKELQALQLTMRVLTPFTPGQDSEGGDGR